MPWIQLVDKVDISIVRYPLFSFCGPDLWDISKKMTIFRKKKKGSLPLFSLYDRSDHTGICFFLF